MKLLTVLAATAAAAAVAAAHSLSAGASPSARDQATTLAACLRAHGLNPPAGALQLKPWLLRHAGQSALKACKVTVDAPQKDASGADLAACLRSHGAAVPAGATGLALKTWVGDHSSDARVMDALKRCGAGGQKPPAKAAGCGGGAAAPARKPGGDG
jgi:hypothetical protein